MITKKIRRKKSYLITPIDEHIGKKLKEFRLTAGISQDELGELVGVAMQQIQKYENAQNRICANRLFEFAQILKRPVSAFFTDLKADRSYYNYDFTPEKNLLKKDFEITTEIRNLIYAFNRIENPNIRKSIITLANSVAKPKRKVVKHQYS